MEKIKSFQFTILISVVCISATLVTANDKKLLRVLKNLDSTMEMDAAEFTPLQQKQLDSMPEGQKKSGIWGLNKNGETVVIATIQQPTSIKKIESTLGQFKNESCSPKAVNQLPPEVSNPISLIPKDPTASLPPVAEPVSAFPVPQDNPVIPPQLRDTIDFANRAPLKQIHEADRGAEFYDALKHAQRSIESAAQADQDLLRSQYKNMSRQELQQNLERAEQGLSQSYEALADGKSNLSQGEAQRFQNIYLNARDKAAMGLGELRKEDQDSYFFGLNSPFAGFNGPGNSRTPASDDSVADVLSGKDQNTKATTQDQLVDRAIMFNGLNSANQAKILGQMKLAEVTDFKFSDGRKVRVPILHNGYLLGAGKTGIDCSSLVSSALPADMRKGRFTTLDYRSIWIYSKYKTFYKPPTYPSERAERIKDASRSFTALDIYEGDQLRMGDLLVYRLPWEPTGHVFVVKNHDTAKLSVDVIEAAQSAGTIRERVFALSGDPASAPVRLLRPGLMALRLKSSSSPGCMLPKRTPAGSAPKGGRK